MLLPEDVIYSILLHCDVHTITSYCMTTVNATKLIDYHFYHDYVTTHQWVLLKTLAQPPTVSLLNTKPLHIVKELHHICNTTNEMSNIVNILQRVDFNYRYLFVDFGQKSRMVIMLPEDKEPYDYDHIETTNWVVSKHHYLPPHWIFNTYDHSFHEMIVLLLQFLYHYPDINIQTRCQLRDSVPLRLRYLQSWVPKHGYKTMVRERLKLYNTMKFKPYSFSST